MQQKIMFGRSNRRARGFSLLELIMVIAIVGLLAAMLLPVLGQAKKIGKRAKCLGNLKQIGVVLTGFAFDHDDRLPWQLTPDLNQYYAGDPSSLGLGAIFSLPSIKDELGGANMLLSPCDTLRATNSVAIASGWAAYSPGNPIPCTAISYVFVQGGDLGRPTSVLAATRNLSSGDLATARWLGADENQPSSMAGLRQDQGHLLMADGSVHKSGDADLGASGKAVLSHISSSGGVTSGAASTLLLCCGQSGGAIPNPSGPPSGPVDETFSFAFKHIDEARAGSYVISQQNVRKYTEWQSPPGTVVAWGNNEFGQSTVPVGLSGVTAVAASACHTVALKSDGTVVAWGRNEFGQSTIPAGLSGVTAMAANFYHTAALKGDGTVVAWGRNQFGETNVPAGLSGVTAIAAGSHQTMALKSDGTVVVWGSNLHRQGIVPAGLSGVIAISAGDQYAMALKRDGTVVAWGNNWYGQTRVPVGLSGVTAIAAGYEYAMALKSDGTVIAWGINDHGQSTVPAGLNGVTAIAAGNLHAVALKSDGTVVAWGGNSRGGQATVPAGLSGVTAIAATSSDHTVVLKMGETFSFRKYTQWQSPPTTYWAPSANSPAAITQKFPISGTVTKAHLTADIASFNFGGSRGGSSIWASKDGVQWELLLDNPVPNRIDSYKTYDGYLPASLLGGSEIYIQVRYLTENSPNSSYSLAQFCRSDAAATRDVFKIEINYKK